MAEQKQLTCAYCGDPITGNHLSPFDETGVYHYTNVPDLPKSKRGKTVSNVQTISYPRPYPTPEDIVKYSLLGDYSLVSTRGRHGNLKKIFKTYLDANPDITVGEALDPRTVRKLPEGKRPCFFLHMIAESLPKMEKLLLK